LTQIKPTLQPAGIHYGLHVKSMTLENPFEAKFAPLTAHIRHVLRERQGGSAPKVRFEAGTEDHLTRREAERTERAGDRLGR
jgi:hypothetical protein